MKNLIIAVFLFCGMLSFAQDQNQEDDKEPKEVPFDFLDRFDSSRSERDVLTLSGIYFGIGWNQALGDDNGIGEDYRFWGSGIFELGYEFSTQLSKSDDLLRFNYGLGFQWQTLRINGNRQFETTNDVTSLEPIGFDVDKSKFEQFSLIAPFHLEIGRGEKKVYKNDIVRNDRYESLVFGIGGYLGLTGTTSQLLKYENEGRDISNRLYNDFEMENFVYGLSAYAGVGSAQIFVKYGLNTIFKNSPVDQQYASIGFRFR
jgi:opacity protein-like surface antigen